MSETISPLGPLSVNTSSFHQVQTTRAYQDIARQIEESVVKGELKPGDRLPSERDMMSIFRVSRATIREALRVLENNGLISVRPGLGGAVVSEFSISAVSEPLELMLQLNQVTPAEMVEYREAIETTAVQWAAQRAEQADLARMRAAIAAAEANIGSWDQFHAADIEFHSAIADASKNGINRIVMKVLRGVLYAEMSEGYRGLSEEGRASMQASMIRGHRAILDLLERRDGETAARAMSEHIGTFRAMVRQPDTNTAL